MQILLRGFHILGGRQKLYSKKLKTLNRPFKLKFFFLIKIADFDCLLLKTSKKVDFFW
jgi:hypothetical protein